MNELKCEHLYCGKDTHTSVVHSLPAITMVLLNLESLHKISVAKCLIKLTVNDPKKIKKKAQRRQLPPSCPTQMIHVEKYQNWTTLGCESSAKHDFGRFGKDFKAGDNIGIRRFAESNQLGRAGCAWSKYLYGAVSHDRGGDATAAPPGLLSPIVIPLVSYGHSTHRGYFRRSKFRKCLGSSSWSTTIRIPLATSKNFRIYLIKKPIFREPSVFKYALVIFDDWMENFAHWKKKKLRPKKPY